jgi:hypothetical protein
MSRRPSQRGEENVIISGLPFFQTSNRQSPAVHCQPSTFNLQFSALGILAESSASEPWPALAGF